LGQATTTKRGKILSNGAHCALLLIRQQCRTCEREAVSSRTDSAREKIRECRVQERAGWRVRQLLSRKRIGRGREGEGGEGKPPGNPCPVVAIRGRFNSPPCEDVGPALILMVQQVSIGVDGCDSHNNGN
jgi:hypothetical protein